MEIPKGMESKFDAKKKAILSKIDLYQVTSPYARLLLKLLSYGVTFEQAVNIKTPMVLAQAYPWCKPLEDYIVDYVCNDRGRIGPEYFLGIKPRDKESQQQSVKACVRALRIVLTPQGITLPMLRYLGDVKNTPQHRARRIKGKDPADQLLSLLRGRITGDEYDKLVNKVKTIQQEERKADNDARQAHRKQTSKDDNEYEPTAAQPQQN